MAQRVFQPKVQVRLFGGLSNLISTQPGLEAYWRFNDWQTYDQSVQYDLVSGFWRLNGNTNDDNAQFPPAHNGVATGAVSYGGTAPINDGSTCAYIGAPDGVITATGLAALGSRWTVEFWVYRAPDTVQQRIAFCMLPLQMGIYANTNDFYVYNTASSVLTQTNKNVSDNAWHYIAVAYDGATIYYYVDGVLIKSWADAAFNLTATSVYIGAYVSAGYSFNGYMSRVSVSGYYHIAETIALRYQKRTHSGGVGITNLVDSSGKGHGAIGTGSFFLLQQQQANTGEPSNFSARFLGTNSYAYCSTSNIPAMNTTFSVEFIFQPLAGSGGHATYQAIWITNTSPYPGIYYNPPAAGNHINFVWGGVDHTASVPILQGNWYHCVASVNAGTLTWYVNGVACGTYAGVPTNFGLNVIGTTASNLQFSGYLDELVYYTSVLSAQDALDHYNALGWTDITADLTGDMKWDKGMQDNSQKDLVAKSGSLDFNLRNDEYNSVKVRSYYSPNSPRCCRGFTFGIPIRLFLTYQGVDYWRWAGRVHSIHPDSGIHGQRQCQVTALDGINDLAETDVHAVAPQLGQNEVNLMTQVHAAMPISARPVYFVPDPALDTYPYAFDDVSQGVRALYAINQVMTSCRGFYYQGRYGYHHYINRQTLQSRTPIAAFVDSHGMDVPASLDKVYNRVRVTQHIRTVNTASIIVLFAASSRIPVAAGATATVFGNYSDPNSRDRLIGGTNFIPTASGTDFTAWSNSNGTGTDLTAYVSVGVTCFAASALFTITNTHPSLTAYVQYQLRGSGIYDNAPTSYDSYQAMAYGDRLLEIDLMYQADQNIARDLALQIRGNVINLANQVETLNFMPQVKAEWCSYAINSEISDVLVVSEDQTGLQAVAVFVMAIRETINADSLQPGLVF